MAGLILVMAGMVAIALFLVAAMVTHIRQEKRRENLKRTWPNFALSIAFCVLFFGSWILQGIVEWQVYVDQQREHRQPVEIVDYLQEFSQSTLENWQSEFLQLFSFVVLAALFIHHGSAESRDSDDRIEETVKKIAAKLDA